MSMNDTYDVVVGGSGMAGSTTATILANDGLDVLLLEAGTHPRFTIGEALLPQSSMWMWIVGEYFDIPEVGYLSDVNAVIDEVTHSCGIKHSVGFTYHERNQPFSGEYGHQLIPPSLPFYSEGHFVREHVDHYLVRTAIDYGVTYLDETAITDVEITDDEVTVDTDRGTATADFFVDATGSHSVLAETLGYHEHAPELETDSRAIFTHVEGLEPFDDLLADEDRPHQSNRLHDGTLHHVFDGGWLWIIPFDNFERSEATNASVGLVLDRSTYPLDESVSAEEEFYRIISAFPDVERHLEPVEAVRPWVRTGRLQRALRRSSGERHYMTNNTYGFVDPLYSNGLIDTFESIFLSSSLLLEAFEDGDFSAERFTRIDELHRKQLLDADFTIASAYKATGDFEVWNAWTQMWLAQILFHDLYIQRHCFKYVASGRPDEFDPLREETAPGDRAPFVPEKAAMYHTIGDALDTYTAGEVPPEQAARVILDELQCAEWLPKHVYPWGDERARHVDFSNPELVGALLEWGKTDSPTHIREGLFDFDVPEMA
ncbi:NAD(P)/FAD-dependent oxidoreductase [Natronobiforma cellulositropha]|uniref:NAD(P)/FAD-dependent oxidoreductase n=1 Tax=Natronobiforma cellulositropha TaxID=1679076 RepID=UPI0021D5DC23|nr:tryptophan 7-halogenase [Natronobiforma cellulositropha]